MVAPLSFPGRFSENLWREVSLQHHVLSQHLSHSVQTIVLLHADWTNPGGIWGGSSLPLPAFISSKRAGYDKPAGGFPGPGLTPRYPVDLERLVLPSRGRNLLSVRLSDDDSIGQACDGAQRLLHASQS